MAEPLHHSKKVSTISKSEPFSFQVIVEKVIATIEEHPGTGLTPFEAAMMAISNFCKDNDGGTFRFRLPRSDVDVSVDVAFVEVNPLG